MHNGSHASLYRCQHSAEIRHSFSALEAYWQRLRGDAASAPALFDFDPTQVDAVLPYSLVIEGIAPGMTRVRVAGTEIDKLFDGDVRGMPFSALFAGPARAHLQALTEQVFSGPAVIEAAVRMGTAQGQMIMLPLTSHEGRITRAICAIIFEDIDLRSAHRCSFAEGEGRIQPLRAAFSTPPVTTGMAVQKKASLRLVAQAGDGESLAGALPRCKGHLRLVSDNA
ncbi:hypothetical protein BVG79_01220 [Ketogulonicigenium robustum]|uniref:PAS domain-containing protein n=1 Tax=Ketogulonicigenium robustum TaxID=92947 RepID=A0A1W6NZ82_9RHOB|nr:PAS domain-containing protein [Ketogulonicigenium robustum]ARO14566.1 hypothetical protein BVG79_01220 [Ketogulonicigenium robustum]